MSTRFEYVTPLQPLPTNELIARIVLVPARRFGPPESPKHAPPLSCEWFAESFRYSSRIDPVPPGMMSAGAMLRSPLVVAGVGLPPR